MGNKDNFLGGLFGSVVLLIVVLAILESRGWIEVEP